MRKLYILISLLITIFGFFVLILYLPRNYMIEYKINDFVVKEVFDKVQKNYYITIKYNKKEYPLIYKKEYSRIRKIISSIKEYSNNKENCLAVKVNKKVFPVCYKEEELIDFRLLSKDITDNFNNLIKIKSEKVIDNYNKTKIYNYNENLFLIWNYKGYDLLSVDKNDKFNLLSEDNYENNLVYKYNNYLLTPNYDQKYIFNELFVINTDKLELKTFNLEQDISYSSFYLGTVKNDFYLLDKKNKKEYQINLKKEKIKIVGNEKTNALFYDSGWKNVSINKLINNEDIFRNRNKEYYKLVDNKLYYEIDKFQILISNKRIKDIIYQNESQVFYLVDNIVYEYNLNDGEVKLLENNEWNFNYENQIFIFD